MRRLSKSALWAAPIIAFTLGVVLFGLRAEPPELAGNSRTLWVLKSGEALNRCLLSQSDPSKASLVITSETGEYLVRDGAKADEFSEVTWIGESPKGELCLNVKVQEEWFFLIEGNRLGPYGAVDVPVFGRPGAGYAFRAWKAGVWYVVNGSLTRGPYSNVSTPVLGPSGELCYFAMDDNEVVLVVGGERKRMDGVLHRLAINPVSGEVAYVIEKGDGLWVMHGLMSRGPYAQVGSLNFSPQGKLFAYFASEEVWGDFLVVNGERGALYDFIDAESLCLADESVAYIASRPGGTFAVVNAQEGEVFSGVDEMVLSEDGREWAYVCELEPGRFKVLSSIAPRMEYDALWWLRFCSRGDHLAYVIEDSGRETLVVNGDKGERVDRVLSAPVFESECEAVRVVVQDGNAILLSEYRLSEK